MTEAQAIQAISKVFASGWTIAQPTVPFAIENEFGGALPTIPPATADRFAFMRVVTTTSNQATAGGVGERLVERNGWIRVKFWVPAGERTDGVWVLIEAAKGILEMKDIAGPPGDDETIDTFTGSVSDTDDGDGRWFTKLLSVPYTFYETK